MQYYGDDYDTRHEEDVKDAVWIWTSTEEDFFTGIHTTNKPSTKTSIT